MANDFSRLRVDRAARALFLAFLCCLCGPLYCQTQPPAATVCNAPTPAQRLGVQPASCEQRWAYYLNIQQTLHALSLYGELLDARVQQREMDQEVYALIIEQADALTDLPDAGEVKRWTAQKFVDLVVSALPDGTNKQQLTKDWLGIVIDAAWETANPGKLPDRLKDLAFRLADLANKCFALSDTQDAVAKRLGLQVAKVYLADFYHFGGHADLVAKKYGLPPTAPLADVLSVVAQQSIGTSRTGYSIVSWLFGYYDRPFTIKVIVATSQAVQLQLRPCMEGHCRYTRRSTAATTGTATAAGPITSPGQKWSGREGECLTPINNPSLLTDANALAQLALRRSDAVLGCVTFPYLGQPYLDAGNGNEAHAGIDLRAGPANAVYAVEAGRVVQRNFDPANGHSTLIIENNQRSRKVLYLHMSRISPTIGEQIGAGQQVGVAGSVGACVSSPAGCAHLHLEMWGRNAPQYCNGTAAVSGSACGGPGAHCSAGQVEDRTQDPLWVVRYPDRTAAPLPGARSITARDQITFSGVGAVRVGMTPAEITAALGDRVIEEYADDAKSCGYATLQSASCGISFMLTDGRVSRADIEQGQFRTAEGIGIGSSAADVRRAYGDRMTSAKNQYSDAMTDITVQGRGNEDGYFLVLQMVAGKVVAFRVGDNSVGLVEGCF